MIYWLLFYEFFKIGLFAIGGGLVTISFLFELTEKYDWFTVEELANMVAVGESTPGPIGVNVATFAGFSSAGIVGGVIATFGLVLPSFLTIILVSKALNRYRNNFYVDNLLADLRPAVTALIVAACVGIGKLAVYDWKTALAGVIFFLLIHYVKISPVFYIMAGALAGVVFQM